MNRLLLPPIVVALCLLLAACELVKIPPKETRNTQFLKIFGGTEDDSGVDIVQTADGGFLIFGNISIPKDFADPDQNLYLVKTDALGNLEWDQSFGVDNREESANAIQVLNDGTIILLGTIFNEETEEEDIYVIKIEGGGKPSPLNTNQFSFESPASAAGRDLLALGGETWIIGSVSPQDPDSLDLFDIALWQVNFDGEELTINENNSQVYNFTEEAGEDHGISIEPRIGGGFVILASVDFEVYVFLTDADQQLVEGRGFEERVDLKDMKVDEAGNIYLLGEKSDDDGNGQIWLNKLNPDLSPAWTQPSIIGESGQFFFSGKFNFTPDGGLLVTGYKFIEDPLADFGLHAQILLARLDASGNFHPDWPESGYQLFGDLGDDIGGGVVPILTGGEMTGIAFTGLIGFGAISKMVLIQTDANGNL